MKSKRRARWTLEFYKDNRNDSPVEEFLDGLQPEERAKVSYYINLLVESGTLLKEPYVKDLKGHKPLWELLPDPIRLIYFSYSDRRFVVLHAFRKKRMRTNRKDIEKAEGRLKVFLEREKHDRK